MVAIIVDDRFLNLSLSRLFKLMRKEGSFFAQLSEAREFLANRQQELEAVILDYDIDPEQSQGFMQTLRTSELDYGVLVYSDFPQEELKKAFPENQQIRIKEKPFLLKDILLTIESGTRRNNVTRS